MIVFTLLWLFFRLMLWTVKLAVFLFVILPYVLICACSGKRSGIYVGRWLRIPL